MDLSTKENGGICEFYLTGSFTYNDGVKFRHIIESIRNKKYHDITLNMSSLEFIDSTAMGLVLLAKEEADTIGTRVIIRGSTGQPKKVMEIAKFDQIFNAI